jgi:hypothetical protein
VLPDIKTYPKALFLAYKPEQMPNVQFSSFSGTLSGIKPRTGSHKIKEVTVLWTYGNIPDGSDGNKKHVQHSHVAEESLRKEAVNGVITISY